MKIFVSVSNGSKCLSENSWLFFVLKGFIFSLQTNGSVMNEVREPPFLADPLSSLANESVLGLPPDMTDCPRVPSLLTVETCVLSAHGLCLLCSLAFRF